MPTMSLVKMALLCTICAASAAPLFAADVTEVSAAQLYQQGAAAYQQRDYAKAIRYFESCISTNKDNADALYYLGNCYLQANQPEKAAQAFSSCVRISPASQAGKYALSALESLASKPQKQPEKALPSQAALEATRDSLTSTKPVDTAYNEAIQRIKADRPTFKSQVDRLWLNLQDDLTALSPRSRTYSIDLERLRGDAEIDLEQIQLKELRHECRVMAPDKIDLRCMPDIPAPKIDDSKNALGSLYSYFKPEKPIDPFDMQVTPELTAKFLNVKDVFGDLRTYPVHARRFAVQLFGQLKHEVETKQDNIDAETARLKKRLLSDIMDIKVADTSSIDNINSPYRQQSVSYTLANSKIPRADEKNISPTERLISDTTKRAQDRIKQLQDEYSRQIDLALSGAKEQLASLVGSGVSSQLKHTSGQIQLVPLGSDLRTHNYVNFGEADTESTKVPVQQSQPVIQPLRAKALKAKPGDAKKR